MSNNKELRLELGPKTREKKALTGISPKIIFKNFTSVYFGLGRKLMTDYKYLISHTREMCCV